MQEKNLDATIGNDLRQLGVGIVYLYGSEALQRANLLSDIDVGIVLKDPRPIADRKQKYKLYSKLLSLLEPILVPGPSREIDLVFLQAASPILRFQAINADYLLFAADPVFQADFEASVIRDYLDVRPMVETHFQAALERVV